VNGAEDSDGVPGPSVSEPESEPEPEPEPRFEPIVEAQPFEIRAVDYDIVYVDLDEPRVNLDSDDQGDAELYISGYLSLYWYLEVTAGTSEGPTPKECFDATRLTRHPDGLTSGQRLRLNRLLTRCTELADLRRHIQGFARMMNQLDGHLLPRWIKAAEGSELPPLRSFAHNLNKDFDAVTVGLTLPYSSGMVEGHINRVKFLKRQGYGRAGFDLLRRRILLTP
jgi:hypothetical protein